MNRKPNHRTCIVLLSVLGVVLTTGCYRKVVNAKGLGADELAPRRSQPTTNVIQDLGAAVRGEKSTPK